MKKVLLATMIAFTPMTANAGLFDSISTIVSGHTTDLINRFSDDQVLTDVNVLKSGIIDLSAVGQDVAHNASGSVTIVEKDGKRYVQLGADFKTGLAPDLHVYVSKSADINEEADFDLMAQVELGKMTKGSGASFYEIPEGVEVNSVTIWCKKFGAYMGSADVTEAMSADEMMEQMMDEPMQGEDMR